MNKLQADNMNLILPQSEGGDVSSIKTTSKTPASPISDGYSAPTEWTTDHEIFRPTSTATYENLPSGQIRRVFRPILERPPLQSDAANSKLEWQRQLESTSRRTKQTDVSLVAKHEIHSPYWRMSQDSEESVPPRGQSRHELRPQEFQPHASWLNRENEFGGTQDSRREAEEGSEEGEGEETEAETNSNSDNYDKAKAEMMVMATENRREDLPDTGQSGGQEVAWSKIKRPLMDRRRKWPAFPKPSGHEPSGQSGSSPQTHSSSRADNSMAEEMVYALVNDTVRLTCRPGEGRWMSMPGQTGRPIQRQLRASEDKKICKVSKKWAPYSLVSWRPRLILSECTDNS
ncbi:unnamed protein product [Protopolystoma xenopodis]|uniref:Uncharacterized protein n=1 Tax=Protopolystoma xenopodis TaxID=117903 RepID=A0A3S5B9W6_9PLAT|nr:unnamed protein product [Protopolystoma xenopodis]